MIDLKKLDTQISNFMYKYGTFYLRISLGFIFIWFGILKPLGMSPAEELVRSTVFWLPFDFFFSFLGWWEVLIGIFMLYRPTIKVAIFLLFLQMPGTALPLLILPEVCFNQFPFGLTLEGQYIIKNLVLISAGLVIGGTANWSSTENKKV
jgi:uncharacterized membrane protein YkgB